MPSLRDKIRMKNQKAVNDDKVKSTKDKKKQHRVNMDSDDDGEDDEDEYEDEFEDEEGDDEEEDDGEDDEEDEFDTDDDDDEYEPPHPKKYNTRNSTHKSADSKKKKSAHVASKEEDDDLSENTLYKKFMTKWKKSNKMAEKELNTKNHAKKAPSSKKDKRCRRVNDRDEDEDDDEDDDEEEDEEELEGDEQNFIIMIGGGEDGFYDDPLEAENAEIEMQLDNDNDDCNSEDERAFMKENYETFDYPKDAIASKKSKSSKKGTKKPEQTPPQDPPMTVEEEYKELQDLKRHLSAKLQKNPHSKILLNTMKECCVSISKLVKNTRTKNAKDYYGLIKTERSNTVNEIDYFKKKLSNKEQRSIMEQMKSINEHIHIDIPYRLKLLQTNLPIKYKATVMQKLNVMRSMEPGENEYNKMKTWVDAFMRVPFNVYKSLSINMNDGMDVCDQYMKNAKNQLDDCVYGLEDAKLQILQMIGQWITNPDAMGTAIAIHGPPGTGKTSLAKEGISKILGREFAFMALGGAGDASVLEGHSYTYEGSTWGRIVQILMESKCMNPVIYFDELDKISDTPRGQEITGILTHLTDKSQNSQFHDKYFSDVEFDLSKCLFIFSYNDENAVNPILKDRMYRIKTKGYDTEQKVIIAKKYMLPKIREQVNFKEGDIIIPDETLKYIISSTKFTQNEQGVRNLNRCLEIIHTKLNLFRLIHVDKDTPSILGKDIDLKVTFPYTVTNKDVDMLIKNEENQNQSLLAMYV